MQHPDKERVIKDSKYDIVDYLKHFTDRKEETDRELVQIETRLGDRIKEFKTDLKSDITHPILFN